MSQVTPAADEISVCFGLLSIKVNVRTVASVFQFATRILTALRSRPLLPSDAQIVVTETSRSIVDLQHRANLALKLTCARHYEALCDAVHLQCCDLLGECCARVATAECIDASVVVPVPKSSICTVGPGNVFISPTGCGCDSVSVSARSLADARVVSHFAFAPSDYFWAKERTVASMDNHSLKREVLTDLVPASIAAIRIPTFSCVDLSLSGLETLFSSFCDAQIGVTRMRVDMLVCKLGGNKTMLTRRASSKGNDKVVKAMWNPLDVKTMPIKLLGVLQKPPPPSPSEVLLPAGSHKQPTLAVGSWKPPPPEVSSLTQSSLDEPRSEVLLYPKLPLPEVSLPARPTQRDIIVIDEPKQRDVIVIDEPKQREVIVIDKPPNDELLCREDVPPPFCPAKRPPSSRRVGRPFKFTPQPSSRPTSPALVDRKRRRAASRSSSCVRVVSKKPKCGDSDAVVGSCLSIVNNQPPDFETVRKCKDIVVVPMDSGKWSSTNCTDANIRRLLAELAAQTPHCWISYLDQPVKQYIMAELESEPTRQQLGSALDRSRFAKWHSSSSDTRLNLPAMLVSSGGARKIMYVSKWARRGRRAG